LTRTWQALRHWLLDTRPARQAFEVLLRALSGRRLARLDEQDPARRQTCLLLGYLHQARRTRFGREHDFARLRTPDDFRRLVPLTTPRELARSWWLPSWPDLAGSTWPDLWPVAGPPDGDPAPVRSAALASARRAALRLALAFVVRDRPQARLFGGRFLDLGGATPFDRSCVPPLLRPYRRTELPSDGPVTCLAGPADRLLALADRVRQEAAVERLADAWPSLAVVLWDGPADAADRLRAAAGDVLLLQTARVLGQPVAVTDPRHGLPRLLTGHAAYFEFVPEAEAGKEQPARLALDGVRPGGRYELVLTTPGGLWACRSGQLVEVATLVPPLVRFLGSVPTPAPPAAPPVSAAAPEPAPPSRRQIGGIPAAPPGTFDHTPWSARAGRG
jgi:GH3 auxin-responsive promoter